MFVYMKNFPWPNGMDGASRSCSMERVLFGKVRAANCRSEENQVQLQTGGQAVLENEGNSKWKRSSRDTIRPTYKKQSGRAEKSHSREN